MQQGVASTNAFINVVDFFSRGMYFRTYELMLIRSPILQVDSICFLYSFRNQVSLLLLPLLFGVLYRCSQHSSRKNSSFLSFHFFCDAFMYATHMPQRLSDGSSSLNTTLCYREQQHALQHFPANCLPSFNQEDIRRIAPQIFDVVPSRIEAGSSPEKMVENDYLMKCECGSSSILLRSDE